MQLKSTKYPKLSTNQIVGVTIKDGNWYWTIKSCVKGKTKHLPADEVAAMRMLRMVRNKINDTRGMI